MKTYAVRLTACLILCCILTLSAPWVLAQDPTPMPVAVSTVAPEVAELTPAAVIPSPLPPELFPQTDLSLAPVYYWQSLQALGLTADDVDNILQNQRLPHGSDQRFWSLEMQALYALRNQYPDGTQPFPGLPAPNDLPQEAAVMLARQSLRANNQQLSAEGLEQLTPTVSFLFDSQFPGSHTWVIRFVEEDARPAVDVGVVEIDAATGAILSTEFPELSIQLAPLGANGRPLIWRSFRLPDYYWEHMEARGDTAVSVRRYLVQVANEHGRDQLFWPVEAMAVHGLWVNNMGFSQTDEFWEIPGLPDQDDISYDRAVEIAWEAFDAAGGSELDEEVRDALRPGVAFKFSSNVPSNHEWYIQFVDMRYVGLVTQGQVIIDAHTGEVVKVEVVSGNG